MKPGKGFIVKREIADNGPMGSTYGYIRVQTPMPRERIYHGKFKPRSVACGQKVALYRLDMRQAVLPKGGTGFEMTMTVFDYVGEGEPQSELWTGDGDNTVEEF